MGNVSVHERPAPHPKALFGDSWKITGQLGINADEGPGESNAGEILYNSVSDACDTKSQSF